MRGASAQRSAVARTNEHTDPTSSENHYNPSKNQIDRIEQLADNGQLTDTAELAPVAWSFSAQPLYRRFRKGAATLRRLEAALRRRH